MQPFGYMYTSSEDVKQIELKQHVMAFAYDLVTIPEYRGIRNLTAGQIRKGVQWYYGALLDYTKTELCNPMVHLYAREHPKEFLKTFEEYFVRCYATTYRENLRGDDSLDDYVEEDPDASVYVHCDDVWGGQAGYYSEAGARLPTDEANNALVNNYRTLQATVSTRSPKVPNVLPVRTVRSANTPAAEGSVAPASDTLQQMQEANAKLHEVVSQMGRVMATKIEAMTEQVNLLQLQSQNGTDAPAAAAQASAPAPVGAASVESPPAPTINDIVPASLTGTAAVEVDDVAASTDAVVQNKPPFTAMPTAEFNELVVPLPQEPPGTATAAPSSILVQFPKYNGSTNEMRLDPLTDAMAPAPLTNVPIWASPPYGMMGAAEGVSTQKVSRNLETAPPPPPPPPSQMQCFSVPDVTVNGVSTTMLMRGAGRTYTLPDGTATGEGGTVMREVKASNDAYNDDCLYENLSSLLPATGGGNSNKTMLV
jgi:hypothetical protein